MCYNKIDCICTSNIILGLHPFFVKVLRLYLNDKEKGGGRGN